jgi:hypothetical protein
VSLPWYVRPIEPSRFAFVWPPLLALLVLAGGGAMATLGASIPPSGFQGPMFLSWAAVGWFCAAFLFVRHRQQGGQGLGFKVASQMACALVLTIMSIPPLLWPSLPFDAPVPPAAVATQRICWWAVGLIGGAFTYATFSHRHRSSGSRPS